MMSDILNIIDDIEQKDSISLSDSFDYSKVCSKALRNIESENEARRLIINILNNWGKLPGETTDIWVNLIEAAGFYPYLRESGHSIYLNNTAGSIRREFHRSKYLPDKIYHEQQKEVSDILNADKNLIVSAPTSFGKSLLIEEIVASGKYKNIVVIQPTLALLDETRKKLKKYSDAYKIIVRTSQESDNTKGNLFLLTAERVMEYRGFDSIDFFIIDEFYKLSMKRDDERCDTLNNAFHLLVNRFNSRFYLLGPNIDGISDGFAEKYNAEFYKTNYSLVDVHEVDVYGAHKSKFDQPRKYKEHKEYVLFDLLESLKEEQTIIYCSSPKRVRELSSKFVKYLKEKNDEVVNTNLNIIEWIKESVSPRWGLIDCLNYGIGVHDGALQRHITSTIINYFNENRIRYLFCTTTIIEGVNTSAKNIVYFDSTKGKRKLIDYFDYSNIKGRSGRLMVHFVGRIFNFNPPPEKKDIIVDIPFFEQNPVNDEVLIHLQDNEVKENVKEQYEKIVEIPQEEREIIRRNGLSVHGQKKIIDILNSKISSLYPYVAWSGMPGYEQLKMTLGLAWDNLVKPGETTSPMTLAKLTKITFDYGITQSISGLVQNTFKWYSGLESNKEKDGQEIFDEAVRDSFQILRHWLHYKVPKWLNVINELQKYVCSKNNLHPGSYGFYASQLENDFVRTNLSILVEYGIPKSAIDKVSPYVPIELKEDDVLDLIKNTDVISKTELNAYEHDKLSENL